MSGARFWQITGLAAAGGVGYYLYNAGGDPKAAEKRAEADLAKAGRAIGVTNKGTEVKKEGAVTAADAGKIVDDGIKDAKQGISNVDKKLESYRKEAEKSIDSGLKDARDNANAAIDKFDKNVTEGAAKAKSGISGWFGGSK